MRKYFVPLLALVVVFTLVAALAGCGGQHPAQPGDGKQTAAQGKDQPQQKAESTGAAWPEWSGPKSLGPAKPLPELWCVEFTYCYKPGYGKVLEINSDGDWSDKTPRKETGPKGKLSAEEFAALKEALSQINWEPLPKSSTKDYVAYHLEEKTPVIGIGFVGYKVKYWAGQTHAVPPYEGREIYYDLKAPCAPEMIKLTDTLKQLLDKYVPPTGNE
ncbi:MAG: hypothetical protein QHH75_11380 [Bacillota bacterium]|nr:hypothetical protein [Bacillota bacterium]